MSSEQGRQREVAIKEMYAKNFRDIIDKALRPVYETRGKDWPGSSSASIGVGTTSPEFFKNVTFRKVDPSEENDSLLGKLGFNPTHVFQIDGINDWIIFGEKDGKIIKGFPVGDGHAWYVQRELIVTEMVDLTTFMKAPHLNHEEGKRVLVFTPEDEELKKEKSKKEVEKAMRQPESNPA